MIERNGRRPPSSSSTDFDRRLFILRNEIRGTQRLLLLELIGSAYVCMAVVATEQSQLLSRSETWRLPVFNISFSVITFHMVAALSLFFLYVYFHSHLQRLFRVFSQISNVSETHVLHNQGLGIWLLGDLVLGTLWSSNTRRYCLSAFRRHISIFLIWYAAPVALTLIWLNYLLRHDVTGTSFLVIILILAVGFGLWSYHLAFENITPRNPSKLLCLSKRNRLFAYTVLFLGYTILVCSFSLNAIYGPPSAVTNAFSVFGYKPYAYLAGKDLSAKPPGWTGENPDEVLLVRGVSFKRENLRYANLAEAFLVQADLRDTDLTGANLKDANLLGAKLQGAVLRRVDLQNTKFAMYDRDGKYIRAADLEGADLSQTNLEGTKMMSPHLKGAFFREANLRNVRLTSVDLRGAILSGADLRGGIFTSGNLQNAMLNGTDLRDASFYAVNLKQTQLQKANLQGASLERTELVDADLRGANLAETNLEGANLQGANLTETQGLTKIQIFGLFSSDREYRQGGADNWPFARYSSEILTELGLPLDHNQRLKDGTLILAGLDLRGTKLQGTNLRGADLRRADLSHADLSEADLRGADLQGANLRKARLGHSSDRGNARFEYADLRRAHLQEVYFINYKLLKGANVYDVADAPKGFFSKAIENGAVSIASDEEWKTFKEADR